MTNGVTSLLGMWKLRDWGGAGGNQAVLEIIGIRKLRAVGGEMVHEQYGEVK